MSVAGLRFNRTHGASSTPLETRSGSYIYSGDPQSFHDWEFRTLMHLKLYEDAVRAKSKSTTAKEDEAPDS